MAVKKQHGGRRKGAGNKPEDGAKGLKRVQTMLDDETIKKADKLGYGNVSLGIRKKFKE